MNISQWNYYDEVANKIAQRAKKRINAQPDWEKERAGLRKEFFNSVGLAKLPAWRDTTFIDKGTVQGDGFQIQKIAWQILPDCWNAAGIYRPDPMPAKQLPTVLYTSGHSGNGTYFSQTHAIMWARRGYVCMVFDTIEQGDNPGDHHGLCHNKRSDWVSMGYSGAAGELWNSMRALDILETLPGVDPAKIGVTGNSGGGAHSFFLAIADERIKAVASSCGIVRPEYVFSREHLVSHCDCMFYHNLYGRDPIEFAALIAPRPLLYCFGIEDYLFSVEQYKELFNGTREIYRQLGCEEKCQLFDYHGPHGYQPESVDRINEWFDEHLRGAAAPKQARASHEIPESQTSVFNGQPPETNLMAILPELLTPSGTIELPQKPSDWPTILEATKQTIKDNLLINFDQTTKLELKPLGNWLKTTTHFRKYKAQFGNNEIWLETLEPAKPSDKVVVAIANTHECARDVVVKLMDILNHTVVIMVPRFCGFNACTTQEKYLLRAGAYAGMTTFMLMLEDLLLTLPAIRQLPEVQGKETYLYGSEDAGVVALYQAILDDQISGAILKNIPESHAEGAYFLNVLKHLDIQHAMGLIAPRRVMLLNSEPSRWAKRLYARLECSENLTKEASVLAAFTKL